MKSYFQKNIKQAVQDINESKGIVTIKITDFERYDIDNDRMLKGSLTKTWKEGKQYHIVNHDLSTNSLVGMAIKKYPEDGILESKLNLNKEISRNLFEDYKFFKEGGQTLEHSHGFLPVKNKYKKNEKGGFDFSEVVQKEYSTVLFGSVSNTPLIDLKSDNNIHEILELLRVASKKGAYTDDYFMKIEKKIKEIEMLLKQPSEDTVSEVLNKKEPSKDTQEQLQYFFNHLKI